MGGASNLNVGGGQMNIIGGKTRGKETSLQALQGVARLVTLRRIF
jgi:hypothetical protein